MPSRAVVIILQACLCFCVLATFELGSRAYSLTRFLEFHGKSAPPTAEAVSRNVAPLLTTKSAEQVYVHVQNQHVELHQQYELAQSVAEGSRDSAFAALVACALSSILLTTALWLLNRKAKSIDA